MANEYRISTIALEVLHDGAAKARISTIALEVLRTVTSVTASTRRRQMISIN